MKKTMNALMMNPETFNYRHVWGWDPWYSPTLSFEPEALNSARAPLYLNTIYRREFITAEIKFITFNNFHLIQVIVVSKFFIKELSKHAPLKKKILKLNDLFMIKHLRKGNYGKI